MQSAHLHYFRYIVHVSELLITNVLRARRKTNWQFPKTVRVWENRLVLFYLIAVVQQRKKSNPIDTTLSWHWYRALWLSIAPLRHFVYPLNTDTLKHNTDGKHWYTDAKHWYDERTFVGIPDCPFHDTSISGTHRHDGHARLIRLTRQHLCTIFVSNRFVT